MLREKIRRLINRIKFKKWNEIDALLIGKKIINALIYLSIGFIIINLFMAINRLDYHFSYEYHCAIPEGCPGPSYNEQYLNYLNTIFPLVMLSSFSSLAILLSLRCIFVNRIKALEIAYIKNNYGNSEDAVKTIRNSIS